MARHCRVNGALLTLSVTSMPSEGTRTHLERVGHGKIAVHLKLQAALSILFHHLSLQLCPLRVRALRNDSCLTRKLPQRLGTRAATLNVTRFQLRQRRCSCGHGRTARHGSACNMRSGTNAASRMSAVRGAAAQMQLHKQLGDALRGPQLHALEAQAQRRGLLQQVLPCLELERLHACLFICDHSRLEMPRDGQCTHIMPHMLPPAIAYRLHEDCCCSPKAGGDASDSVICQRHEPVTHD